MCFLAVTLWLTFQKIRAGEGTYRSASLKGSDPGFPCRAARAVDFQTPDAKMFLCACKELYFFLGEVLWLLVLEESSNISP